MGSSFLIFFFFVLIFSLFYSLIPYIPYILIFICMYHHRVDLKNKKTLLFIFLLIVSTSFSFTFLMGNSLPALKTVPHVDIDKFMGAWYVIATKPTPFAKGACNGVETYQWKNKEKGEIDIEYRFNQDTVTGKEKVMTQKGYIYNKTTFSEWRVSPLWPIKLPYLILEVDEECSYTVIGYPSRAYCWIMARKIKWMMLYMRTYFENWKKIIPMI